MYRGNIDETLFSRILKEPGIECPKSEQQSLLDELNSGKVGPQIRDAAAELERRFHRIEALAAARQNELRRATRWRVWFYTSAVCALLILIVGIAAGSNPSTSHVEPVPLALLYISAITLILALLIFTLSKDRFTKSRRETIRKLLEETLKARTELDETVVKVAGDLTRRILNERAGPFLQLRLYIKYDSNKSLAIPDEQKVTESRGLSESFYPEFIVDTAAAKKIAELLRTLSCGASIGISGPRGVGKSTLLVKFCKNALLREPSHRRKTTNCDSNLRTSSI